MQLLDKIDKYIREESGKTIIGITGGGGKTSILVALGKYYRAKGKKVLLSTTTKIQTPKLFNFGVDKVFLDESNFFNHEPKNGESVVYVENYILDTKKAIAPRKEILTVITEKYDVVIFEADGARCLPCKIHSDRDPVITENMTSIIALVGLSSYGEMATNVCMGETSTEIVDASYYQKLIDNEEGLLKGVNKKHKAVILFNQSDIANDMVFDDLKKLKAPCPILIGSVKNNCYKQL